MTPVPPDVPPQAGQDIPPGQGMNRTAVPGPARHLEPLLEVQRDLHQDLQELAELAVRTADVLAHPVGRAARLLTEVLRAGGTILVCGNGGSAAEAQHFVAELVVKMGRMRQAFAAVSLTVDSSILTAAGNDLGYDQVFARQVEALGRPGDALVALTTSGRSANILHVVDTAHRLGLPTVVLTGMSGAAHFPHATVVLAVPSDDTQRIQEIHLPLLHALCAGIELGLTKGLLEPQDPLDLPGTAELAAPSPDSPDSPDAPATPDTPALTDTTKPSKPSAE